jgi:hypothetical protein
VAAVLCPRHNFPPLAEYVENRADKEGGTGPISNVTTLVDIFRGSHKGYIKKGRFNATTDYGYGRRHTTRNVRCWSWATQAHLSSLASLPLISPSHGERTEDRVCVRHYRADAAEGCVALPVYLTSALVCR